MKTSDKFPWFSKRHRSLRWARQDHRQLRQQIAQQQPSDGDEDHAGHAVCLRAMVTGKKVLAYT